MATICGYAVVQAISLQLDLADDMWPGSTTGTSPVVGDWLSWMVWKKASWTYRRATINLLMLCQSSSE
jgi:hypothetical protein